MSDQDNQQYHTELYGAFLNISIRIKDVGLEQKHFVQDFASKLR